jgi:hypothetical protein
LKPNPWRQIAAAAMILAGHLYVLAILTNGLTDKAVASRDFISYWAAGKQLLHGGNPYDFAAVRSLERSAGLRDDNTILMMRNLPTALFLAWPLGFFTPTVALTLWLLASLASLSVSLAVIWLLLGKPDSLWHLCGYAFAPALACLMAGQFGIFLLLGFVLFLYFCNKKPFLAGAFLLLCATKPHLFLPLATVLVLWIVRERAYWLLAGFLTALAASCALAFHLDAHAWAHYSFMMHNGGALQEPVPTLSVLFRLFLDPQAVWLQFFPATLACLWAVWYFWSRRERWDWLDQGLLVLLVSAMVAPFGWFFDEVLLLPALLIGLQRAADAHRALWPIGLLAAAALAELFGNVNLTTPFYLWTTPAWLAWYLYATGRVFSGKAEKTLPQR